MKNKLKAIIVLSLISIFSVLFYFYFFGRSQNIVIGLPEKNKIVGDNARYVNIKSCDEFSQAVIQKYNIDKEKIHSCISTEVLDENYSIVEIEYGEAQDCPAGCFYETQVYKVSADKKTIEIFEDGIDSEIELEER